MQHCYFPKFSCFSQIIHCTKRHKYALLIPLSFPPSLPGSPLPFRSRISGQVCVRFCILLFNRWRLFSSWKVRSHPEYINAPFSSPVSFESSGCEIHKAANENIMLVKLLLATCMSLLILSTHQGPNILTVLKHFGLKLKTPKTMHSSQVSQFRFFRNTLFLYEKSYLPKKH